MDYQYIIAKLEEDKKKLAERLAKEELPQDEYELLKQSIENYDYIIQLTEMNHFERGLQQ